MKIQILGTGCPNCKKLEASVRQAAANLGLDAEFEKVDTLERIMAFGVAGTPALAVDGKVLSAGRVLSVRQAEELLG